MATVSLLHDLLDVTAARHPDRPAVGCLGEVATFQWVQDQSMRLARWLRDCGINRGDRIVIALPAGLATPALLYACSRVSAPFIVVRQNLPDTALAHILDDATPALLLADSPAACGMARERGITVRGSADLNRAGERYAAGEVTGPLTVDPACFVYTSGSTGMPKAVVSTHAQMTFAARAIQSQLEYQPGDVVYSALPLSFDYGLYQIFLCTLAAAQLSLGSADDAGRLLLARLQETGATVLPAVPALAAGLARLLGRPGAAPPRLRLLTNTGATMPPQVLAQLRALIPGLQVQLMFGLTECKRAAIMPKDGDLDRPGACGRALPDTEIFAVDPDGTRLPPGMVGELIVRGPHVMTGYWRRPELTAQRFARVDGLFTQLRTGDFGWLDDQGYLYFGGRRDDQYKERGVRVSTSEVEAAAHRVPGVEAAVALPPDSGSDSATLVVVATISPEEVLAGLRQELEDIKVPGRCLVVGSLPLTGHGKVDRPALSHMATRALT